MTVEILRLSGMDTTEAEQAANVLIDLRTGPRDLRNLLVLDDTALLVEHEPVYRRLDTAQRVEGLLCVAVGPRPENHRELRLPGNLGGTQGSPTLWVSDPSGIDWRVATAATALGHPPGKASGLDHLVELLTVEDMFKRVCEALKKVPGRVASPGLRLAGANDEAATYAAALSVAIRRISEPGPGAHGPFTALLAAQAGGATVADGGPLDRYRAEVTEAVTAASDALRKLNGLGRLRHGDDEARTHLVEAGAALTDLRDLVARLLQEANATGELTPNKRRLVSDAGLSFPPEPTHAPSTPTSAADQPPIHRVLSAAIRGGDPLALITRRLTLTERELKRHGSASYLDQVEELCPPSLLARLADPPQRLPRRASPEARHELGLDDAVAAAQALEDLVVTVANQEWSPMVPLPGEVARIRVALDGVSRALTERADQAGRGGGGARGARLAQLGESLTPVLRDLVLRVLAAEAGQPSTSGQEAFGAARKRTTDLLDVWAKHVQADGISSPPPFATSSMHDADHYADADDVAVIREALLYRPNQEMWQLCGPGDLGVLNATAMPEAVGFASRLSKDALAGTLPGDQPVWTSHGSYAGLLRLVPLRPGFVSSNWGATSTVAGP